MSLDPLSIHFTIDLSSVIRTRRCFGALSESSNNVFFFDHVDSAYSQEFSDVVEILDQIFNENVMTQNKEQGQATGVNKNSDCGF